MFGAIIDKNEVKIIDIDSETNKSRREEAIRSSMLEMKGYLPEVLVQNIVNNDYDQQYIKNGYIYDARGFQDYDWWKPAAGEQKYVLQKVAGKDNEYIVCEQKGYKLDVKEIGGSFILNYDDNEHVGKATNISTNYSIHFDEDGTYECTYLDGYYGSWEMFDNNLLIMYPPEGYDSIAMFYLDFEENIVYIPVFIQSDAMLPIAEQVKISYP